jgi:hypothetical protein
MRQFCQRAAHGFRRQARIRVHDFGDRQAGGERLQDERHGNARAAHTRASAQMFRVSDNPVLHAVKLLQLRNKSSHVALVDDIENIFTHLNNETNSCLSDYVNSILLQNRFGS